jgi:hypothetical protein
VCRSVLFGEIFLQTLFDEFRLGGLPPPLQHGEDAFKFLAVFFGLLRGGPLEQDLFDFLWDLVEGGGFFDPEVAAEMSHEAFVPDIHRVAVAAEGMNGFADRFTVIGHDEFLIEYEDDAQPVTLFTRTPRGIERKQPR